MQQLGAALRRFPGARIVRRLPHMKTVVIELPGSGAEFSGLPGISFAGPPLRRTPLVEPALAAMFRPGLPYEWQYVVTRENEVPEEILRAASAIKIAVVDTGLDVTHPDIAAKAPETWDVVHHRTNVVDKDGHGTFVSSLAAGSVDNNEGIAGFGGDAQLLMVKAVGAGDSFSDVDEAAAIVYAVDHGANIINLSIGGEGTSPLEQRAIEYAASHNVLLVAAAGNEYEDGNPVEYPAAALQPVGSKGQGGVGLSVAASTMAGKRAPFSNTGSQISLAAPGSHVFGAVAAGSPRAWWPRYELPGSLAGLYGWSSGTSFSSPEVAGAAALVWAANPSLAATQVAGILKATASGRRKVDSGARLRRDRRRGCGCERPRTEGHPPLPGCIVAERPPPSRPFRSAHRRTPRLATPQCAPRRAPADNCPDRDPGLPGRHAPDPSRRKLASHRQDDDPPRRRNPLDVRASPGTPSRARRLSRPSGPTAGHPREARPRPLS